MTKNYLFNDDDALVRLSGVYEDFLNVLIWIKLFLQNIHGVSRHSACDHRFISGNRAGSADITFTERQSRCKKASHSLLMDTDSRLRWVGS